MMQARVHWVEDMMFVAESGSGHALVIDGSAEGGGRNMGMRPMELVALGVAGCSSYDVVSILHKARQQVSHCEAGVSAERASKVPAVFESIHLHFRVSGSDLSEAQVARAIKLSAEKYCSASIMLQRAGVKVTHDYEIVSEDQTR